MTVDRSNARICRMFGQIAPNYDRMNHLLSLHCDRYWRWRTAQMLAPADGAPILDVCTGTGDLAFAFYRRTRGKAPVIGADFCRPMLQIGEQKKRKVGIRNQVIFVEADAQRLPFDDNHFQIVSVAFGLRNIADPRRGLGEMTRVCRPGGKVAVLEFSMPGCQPLKAVYGLYFRHILPRVGQSLARNAEHAYDYLPQSVGEFPFGRELVELMQQAGLSRVSVRPLSFGIAILYIGVKSNRKW